MVRVKVCGITNNQDARKAVACGAWAVGFIFYKRSPRYISAQKAHRITKTLPPAVKPIGVFVDEDPKVIKEICRIANIKTVQLHGNEEPSVCGKLKGLKIIKAFRVHKKFDFQILKDYPADAFMFDTYRKGMQGGTGKTFSWEIIRHKRFQKPYILSGGLNPKNIKRALQSLNPYGVDVSSGIELSQGKKNHRLMDEFFKEVFSIKNRRPSGRL